MSYLPIVGRVPGRKNVCLFPTLHVAGGDKNISPARLDFIHLRNFSKITCVDYSRVYTRTTSIDLFPLNRMFRPQYN